MSFEIRVQPRASRSKVVGEHDGALKVKVTAPPLDGRANDECIKLLADTLKVARGAIDIISGETSRSKVVRVSGINAEELRRNLSTHI